MKFGDMIVQWMSMKQRGSAIGMDGNLPFTVKVLVNLLLNPLQDLFQWRTVKPDVDLSRLGVDSKLLDL